MNERLDEIDREIVALEERQLILTANLNRTTFEEEGDI